MRFDAVCTHWRVSSGEDLVVDLEGCFLVVHLLPCSCLAWTDNENRMKIENSGILAAVFTSFILMPSLRAVSPKDILDPLLPLVEAFVNKSLDDNATKRRDIAADKLSPKALDEAFQKQAAKLQEEIASRRKKE